MPDEWYLFQEDQELGPYSWEELLSYVESGAVQPEDLVWAEGLDDWTEAGQVEGLFPETLPEIYDQDGLVPLEASMPVPLPPPIEVAPARNPLPVIFLILAFFLLVGGGLTFVLSQQGSETADEAVWFEPADGYFADDELMATAQSSSPTGPSMFSMGPGIVPAAFSRTTPADSPPGSSDYPDGPSTPSDPAAPPGGQTPGPGGEIPGPGGQIPGPGGEIPGPGGQIPGPGGQIPGPGGSVTPQHTVRDLTISYQNNSVILIGTRVDYSFNYYTNHWGRVQIVGTPLFNGAELHNVAYSHSLSLPSGLGSGSGSFTVNSPQRMNQFRVRMNATFDRSILHERLFNVNYEFRDDVTDDPDPDDPDPDVPVTDQLVASFTITPATPTNTCYVVFDASSSTPANQIEKYSWSFNNEAPINVTDMQHSLTGFQVGNHTVKLTVEDGQGNTDSHTKQFTVTDSGTTPDEIEPVLGQPYATFFSSPNRPVVGETITFDASNSSSPNGSINRYIWHFDDNTAARIVSTPTTRKTYEQPGRYIVTLRIVDEDGAEATVRRRVEVQAAPNETDLGRPRASFTYSPSSPEVGETVQLNASTSSSPNGDIVSYNWTFSDGTTLSNTPDTIEYQFTEPGRHVVSLEVKDSVDQTNTLVRIIVVGESTTGSEPGIPTAKFTYRPRVPRAGQSVAFDATASSTPNDRIVSYAWDVEGVTLAALDRPTFTYRFASAGTYSVGLTVTDNAGKVHSVARTIVVIW